jgi:hypothetical protein
MESTGIKEKSHWAKKRKQPRIAILFIDSVTKHSEVLERKQWKLENEQLKRHSDDRALKKLARNNTKKWTTRCFLDHYFLSLQRSRQECSRKRKLALVSRVARYGKIEKEWDFMNGL